MKALIKKWIWGILYKVEAIDLYEGAATNYRFFKVLRHYYLRPRRQGYITRSNAHTLCGKQFGTGIVPQMIDQEICFRCMTLKVVYDESLS